jgi:hypothetical protein
MELALDRFQWRALVSGAEILDFVTRLGEESFQFIC